MSLSIDDRPVVTPSMAYEKKGGRLYKKNKFIKELISGYHNVLGLFQEVCIYEKCSLG